MIADCRFCSIVHRQSKIGNSACHSSLPSSAFLGCDREERAELLLDFSAFAFGASDPLLFVVGHG
jgi:hypothetical protein